MENITNLLDYIVKEISLSYIYFNDGYSDKVEDNIITAKIEILKQGHQQTNSTFSNEYNDCLNSIVIFNESFDDRQLGDIEKNALNINKVPVADTLINIRNYIKQNIEENRYVEIVLHDNETYDNKTENVNYRLDIKNDIDGKQKLFIIIVKEGMEYDVELF
jgi:hypothetical protein